jgi:hypothetical protein
MIDLMLVTDKLDSNFHDLDIVNYDLQLVEGIDQVRQKLECRLQFFFGEWFLDNTQGIKLYETVYVKNPNLSIIASLFKSTILDTRDVNSIIEYNQTYDPKTRKLSIDFKVDTIYGILETSVII